MYYKRDLEEKIEQYLETSEIIAIFGPRQVGKTTLLKEFYNRVENSIFLTFEDIGDKNGKKKKASRRQRSKRYTASRV